MKNISDKAFFALMDAKTPEEFLVTKDLLNLHGKFNEKNSLELVTIFIVHHKYDVADKLAAIGEFTIKQSFATNNYSKLVGCQKYIKNDMEKFIRKHYKK